jgi:hypothetical protein
MNPSRILRIATLCHLLILSLAPMGEARVLRLRIERREAVLGGKPFGLAGPYEKLVGKVDFALDPKRPENLRIVDLALAPRDAQGDVLFSADFYLLKPVDVKRGNGGLFYEVGNRGTKGMLPTFQNAAPSSDPTTEAEFGNGWLMRQGFALLWMGWQWDVPDDPHRMRMEMPIATDHGNPITGLIRANIIVAERAGTASLGDRAHKAYPVIDPTSAENVMTVRALPLDPPQSVPRSQWHFPDSRTVALDGGFEPGKIYDVVYRSRDPHVVGCGLAGTRDLISFFKYGQGPDNPLAGIRYAISWGASESGRLQRHLLYQGFNQDESGRLVFDGLFDQVGGAGRGSFNHRFGQASRDAEQFFDFFYPVDLFPFTDGPETDPETGVTDAVLLPSMVGGPLPKVFHLLSNSEYYNRSGSLIHTDPTGAKDADLPENTRIYMIASAHHSFGAGKFPPDSKSGGGFVGQALLNPLDYSPCVRALFHALDLWVSKNETPPPSQYPRLSDGTLTTREQAGWPAIPGVRGLPLPSPTYRFDFGPEWSKGIVSYEPPRIGKPFVVRVPAVDRDGNVRSGIRLPEIAVPLATQTGWNYRDPSTGAPERMADELGSYFPFPRTKAEREKTGDPRLSIEERYRGEDEYMGKIAAVALQLLAQRYLLPEDLSGVLSRADAHYRWATTRGLAGNQEGTQSSGH